MTDGREIDKAEILAYACVVQGESYIEILSEQFFVKGISAIFLFQGLIDKESSVLAAAVQFVEPMLGRVDEFETLGVCMYAARGIRQEESGWA